MGTPSTLVGRSGSQATAAPGYHLLVMGPAQFATFALPARGEVLLGRGGVADVSLDDARASRRHARLRIGEQIEIEDLGSANGTRLRGRRLEPRRAVKVLPGEAIGVGDLVLMVQPNLSSGSSAARRAVAIIGHREFQSRVEWECARAEATAGTFSVAQVLVPEWTSSAAASGLRPIDVVGAYGPGAYELLMPALAAEAATRLARAVGRQVGGGGIRVGTATYPEDGRNADALLASAGARARGVVAPAAGGASLVGLRESDALDENMRRVHALAARAAAGEISLVILGETGVGKEVLTRAIHGSSARAARPLVSVNCAALSESLLESELFGHERGAFTGATQAKPGLLETAPGGTVFLDEVGELPLALQAKLLRVIEAREIVRVGGVRPRKIDVRFIAATNRDLEAEVQRGAFRRDLYFRLNGMTLVIPPLRERPLDLPRLARQLVIDLARQVDPRRRPALSDEALAVLTRHAWPGNVRELRNVIERALLLCDSTTITPAHLGIVADPAAPPVAAIARHDSARDGKAIDGRVIEPAGAQDPERVRVLEALAACAGNQSRAARRLGISRKVLIARLDAYGVARPRKPVSR